MNKLLLINCLRKFGFNFIIEERQGHLLFVKGQEQLKIDYYVYEKFRMPIEFKFYDSDSWPNNRETAYIDWDTKKIKRHTLRLEENLDLIESIAHMEDTNAEKFIFGINK